MKAVPLPRALWAVLGLMLFTGLAGLPHQVRFLAESLPVIRLWADREAQQRRHLEPVPYDLLRTADALVPRDAPVLLVTGGEDVRHLEYVTFHRALYFLAPRPVWWVTPAPADGTWESRWWITRPLTPESIRALATEKRATYLVAIAGSGLPELGATVARVGDGRILTLDGRDAGRDRSSSAVADVPTATAEGVAGLARAAAALVTLWGLGAGWLAAVGWAGYRVRHLEAAALAWPLGAALGSLGMLGMHAAGLTLGGQVAILGVLGLAGASWGVRLMCRAPRTGSTALDGEIAPGHRALRALLVAVIVFQVALVAVLAAGRPLRTWDSWAIWGLKARTIFLEGGLSPAVYADPSRASTHPYYPLLLPLTEAWLYAWLGTPDDRLVGLVSVLFYLSLVGISYATVRRRVDSPTLGLGVAAVVGSIPHLARGAWAVTADLPLAVLALAATVYLAEWLEEGAGGALAIAALAAGAMGWTKQEGLILLVALCVAAVVVASGPHSGAPDRRLWLGVAALLVAGALLAGPWLLVVGAKREDLALAANLGRASTITRMVAADLLALDTSFVWPLALLIALRGWRTAGARRRTAADLLPATATLYLVLVSTAYLFSTYVPYQQHVASSFHRLATHVMTLLVLWMAGRGMNRL